jgi:hypothetical protein
LVTVALASLTVATRNPESYNPYSTTPTSSDEADQANTTELSVVATCRTPEGTDGARVSAQADVDTVVEVTSE